MYLLFAVRVLAALLVVYTRAEWEHAAQALSGNYEFTVVYGVAFYFLLQISTRYFRLPEASHWNGNAMIALIILPLVAAWITTEMVYGMMVKADGTAGDILLTACIVLLLFLGFVVFAVYAYVQKAAGERLALELQIQKERANAEYYSMLNEQYTNQRILVHDTSRHLQSIKNLLSENDSPALMEYVAEMEKEVHSQQMVRLCDNAVLNAILFRHAEFCRQNGIEYSFDIREHAVDSMTAVDITALFDNLLSNAAEAAIQAEKRFMELSAVRDDVSLLITLVNACDTPPETDGSGALVTGKSDKNSHGIGMKSIARVVKKYGGVSDFYYNPDERQFHMVIHIPLL